MIQHYFSLKYEDFTGKIISAYAILKTIDETSNEDIEKIKWIQSNTHEDVRVSLWKLDRSVNPTKGDFKIVNNKRSFNKNNATDEDREQGEGSITLTEDSIQHYLCEAINEVHRLVAKNIKNYKEEIPFGSFFNNKDGKSEGKQFGFT